MKRITIKNLIDFNRKKNNKTKATFVHNLKNPKEKKADSGGGDYWITSLSAISNVFKYDNPDLLDEKINELNEKVNLSKLTSVKNQFQRNIDILEKFKDFDFNEIKPDTIFEYLKIPKLERIFNINGFPMEANPRFVFTYKGINDMEIGGVWFIAKLDGFTKIELGMFSDMIYRYLVKIHSGNYFVNPKYCIAIDVTSGFFVDYTEIENKNISSIIESTIDEIKIIQ